jgi:glucan phosphoethanolaminetransferase (alkaline phosphatase superfamily)
MLPQRAVDISFTRRNVLWTVLALALFAVTIIVTSVRYASPDAAGHAYSHLVVGVPVLLLAVTLAWLWRPHRTRTLRDARVLLVLTLLILGGSQLLESIGAFGYRGDDVIHPLLQTLHNTTTIAAPLAFLVIISFAILLASFSVATHVRNPLTRRLLCTALAAIALLLLAFAAVVILGTG